MPDQERVDGRALQRMPMSPMPIGSSGTALLAQPFASAAQADTYRYVGDDGAADQQDRACPADSWRSARDEHGDCNRR